jgi:LuxR family maltose regulon positive regulatory protein
MDAASGGLAGVVSRPVLFKRLGGPARVTMVSAPAGSGKTVLLRSWLSQAGLEGRAAWVSAERDERDPQSFWLSVVNALRQTSAGGELVRAVSAAPDLDGWTVVERLLEDLAGLVERVWLVVDDVHELEPPEVLRQLELLMMRAPPGLRFVLAARHDVSLGLHRLRLEGELAEVRAADLKFSLAEARQLLAAAGVELPGPALQVLWQRTEGWAAGLRLAALSLAGHPDLDRFAAEFSGTERTVAEYLLAEVLDRQSWQVRRLLLRTSVLERVNGELARLLTGDASAERVLQDLEQAGAFVTSLDATRTWFRYHQMFAGLLRMELRRAEPGAVAGLHQAAAGWFASNGYPVEAVRHAQAAKDYELAAALLAGHWPGLYLDGHGGAVHELLTGFPAGAAETDGRLAVVAAADGLLGGSLETVEGYLGLAERGSEAAPEALRDQLRLLLAVVGLLLARQRGNLPTVTEYVERLRVMADAADATQPGLGEDLRALALISLGYTEYWSASFGDAERHLERGITLARQIGRPYLEFTGMAYQAAVVLYQSFTQAADQAMRATELARLHGWTDDPAFAFACAVLATVLTRQRKLDEADRWVQRAERILRAEAAQPAKSAAVRYVRGMLELARNRNAEALVAFENAEPLARRLASPHYLTPRTRASLLQAMVRLGETVRAEQFLAGLSDQDRYSGEIRISEAALRLVQDDPRTAAAVLAPVLDGSAVIVWQTGLWLAQAYELEAIAREAMGDPAAADSALERALDLAEPNGDLMPFLLYPAAALLERHSGQHTAHAALIAEIRSLLAPTAPPSAPLVSGPRPLPEPLRVSEVRVLRYLPTNLTAPEIARELSITTNTVKTHMRNLYAKFGTHRRAETVERARAIGLLAPSGRPQR